MGNLVAIVGRPNVGKSTLFNRLIGGKLGIVDDIPGVTRDRNYGTAEWNGKSFTVIDTGGFVKNSDDIFEAAIRDQVNIAIEEADVIIFLTDALTGITDLDAEIANMLRRVKKTTLLVVNKADNHDRLLEANEFWALGFDNTFFVSAMTGSGTGEICDFITEHIEVVEDTTGGLPRFAIVGQPNVGKSSLVNALLEEERNIVTDIAGTTRDSIHSHYKKYGKEFIIVDTAGIRKKARVKENLEFYSVMRAINAIEECDVCIILIDATCGIEAQDLAIFNLAKTRHKGIVFLINKWDLLPKETNTARDMEEEIKNRLAPFRDVPIIFTSVTEKQRIMKAIEVALEVNQRRAIRIKTSELNDILLPIIERTPPPVARGRMIKIKYITQLPIAYPAFVFFASHPKYIREDYKHFLENQLREHFNFSGVPMEIYFREK